LCHDRVHAWWNGIVPTFYEWARYCSDPKDMASVIGGAVSPQLSRDQIWKAINKRSFAVVSYVTPRGEPRSSGVVYKALGGRLYVAAASKSWKARHIALSGRVSVTVPVRRGAALSLVLPIPPATISFPAAAIVHEPGSPQAASLRKEIGALLPPERRGSAAMIELTPEGAFVTYGLGISLLKMRHPESAKARVAVPEDAQD
jgi:hypothetical protein